MLNALSELGADVRQGRADNLHVSGHAYQEELTEVLRWECGGGAGCWAGVRGRRWQHKRR